MIYELTGVSKTYRPRRGAAVCALRDVSLNIAAGETVAVVGPSGAGKSTLLHVLGGLTAADEGKVLFEGADLAAMKPACRAALRGGKIGVVMQNFALIDDYSVLQNVMTPLYFQKCGDRRERALAALERVNIAHLKDKRAGEISGGEKQRCAIARALAGGPSVLLADEPTGQLDTATAEGILQLFCSLGQDGITVVIVTHDEKVASACGRRVTITDGRILADTAAQR